MTAKPAAQRQLEHSTFFQPGQPLCAQHDMFERFWMQGATAADCLGHEVYSEVQPAPYAETPEGKAAAVRTQRDAKLAACDWTQLADAPLTTEGKLAWGEYRQALRDVPGQAGFPLVVEWPVVPGA